MSRRRALVRRLPIAFAWGSVVGATGLLAASGCARQHEVHMPRRVAFGATEHCPRSPATLGQDPSGAGEGFSPDAVRCSYDDALGGHMIELRGHVRADLGPANPGRGMEGLVVSLHERSEGASLASSTGPVLARGRSDAQGAWRISALVRRPGDYLVVVREEEEGPVLAFQPLEIEGPVPRGRDGITLVLPRDPALVAP